MDGDFQLFVLLNSISVILRWWEDDNERLCVMEPHLWFERFLPPVDLEPRTARSTGDCLPYLSGYKKGGLPL